MDNRLEIPSSRFKNTILSLSGILMTLMSGFMLLAGLYSGSYLYNLFTIIIGLFGTLFFGSATLFYFKNIFVSKPILIINNDGFYDNSSILSMKNSLIS